MSSKILDSIQPLKEYAQPFLYRTTRLTVDIHPYVENVPPARTTRFVSSFIIRTAEDWNNLPASVFLVTYDVEVFKRRVNKLL